MLKQTTVLLCVAFLVGGCGEGGGSQTTAAHPGEQIYNRSCFSCHASGAAGAPRLGDVAAWEPRIAKGPVILLESTIKGIPPGMPAKGMCMQCSDEALAAAIDYMIEHSQ